MAHASVSHIFPEVAQMMGSLEKEFKSAIMKESTKLKNIISNKTKECIGLFHKNGDCQ